MTHFQMGSSKCGLLQLKYTLKEKTAFFCLDFITQFGISFYHVYTAFAEFNIDLNIFNATDDLLLECQLSIVFRMAEGFSFFLQHWLELGI